MNPFTLFEIPHRWVIVCTLLVAIGCDRADTKNNGAVEKPRPVEVATLKKERPPASAWVSASVGSWKTEDIGFEVSGRIKRVTEPNRDIEGRVIDPDTAKEMLGVNGQPLLVPTKVAEIEDERYRLKFKSAQAAVKQVRENIKAAKIELDERLKYEKDAAIADNNLAQLEFNRLEKLRFQQAASKAELESANARKLTAEARVKQLDAQIAAKAAEIVALEAQEELAQQDERDAERDVEDCTLYSSFRGQVADVFVVPGSVVTVGQAVATIQMMNPIKIELEVSGDDARRLRKRQRLPLQVVKPDGMDGGEEDKEDEEGFLYLIDPVADPETRTYTLTLLMINKKNVSAAGRVPVTDQAWRVDFSFLPGAEDGMTYVPKPAIRKDQDGDFLWRINNFHRNQPLPPDNLIEVSKLRIKKGPVRIPFLGNWLFQQILIEDETFDPGLHLVAGALSVNEGDPDDWDGDKILVERGNPWMVRPGDLVKVDLSDSDQQPGFFVPMNAIARDDGKAYLFIVNKSESSCVVNKQEIRIAGEQDSHPDRKRSISSLLRVEPIGDATLLGKQYVTRGAHYLRDRESVRITNGQGVAQ